MISVRIVDYQRCGVNVMTDIFYDCILCEQAGRQKQQEAEIMIIRIKPEGLEFDLVCKKCSGIKRARMAEKKVIPLKYKPKSFEARLN